MSVGEQAEFSLQGEVIPPHLAVKAMRDSGYKNTAYALAELVDNAVQALATEVEVFCVEAWQQVKERKSRRVTEIAVLDNGSGMEPETLRLALQFGNGTHLEDRAGIGRFGMGLPNSSISQCRRVDVWTWQNGPENAMWTYLDLSEIELGNLRHVPTPKPDAVPKRWQKLSKALATTGTLITWTDFDEHRLTWKSARSTLNHTEQLAGRMYRKFIHDGDLIIRLVTIEDEEVVDTQEAAVNDPLYLMRPSSTPAPFDKEPMFQEYGEEPARFNVDIEGIQHEIVVRASWARQQTEDWKDKANRGDTTYGKHAAKNIGLSIVRAKRELDLDDSWANSYDPTERWWSIEIDFPPALDEIFGVTNNKQAATLFSHMAQFDWKTEAEPGESFTDYRRRLKDDGDPRHYLLELVNYIHNTIPQLRSRLKDQTKGARGGRRHEEPNVEDRATKKIKRRAEDGYETEFDKRQFDESAYNELLDDLIDKHRYPEKSAREIADAVRTRGRKVIFVEADNDSPAFFLVEHAGSVTEIIFNRSHPAFEQLLQVLDTDISTATDRDLVERIRNASDTLKMLLAAWARYEEEDVPARERIRDMRYEWGKMARDFLSDEE